MRRPYRYLYSIGWAIENGIEVVNATQDETVDKGLPGLNRKGMANGTQMPELKEAATETRHRQFTINNETTN